MGNAHPAQYLNIVWQVKPAINVVEPGQPANYITRKAAETSPHLVDLSTSYPQAIKAELIYLSPHSVDLAAMPNDATLRNRNFADKIGLVGYQTHDDFQTITLFWTSLTKMTTDYTISVRLWQFGQPIQTETGPLQQDHQPVWNTFPTSQWPEGGLISDAYTFDLPPDARPEQMHIVVYHQTETGFENLGDLLIDLQ